MRVKKTPQPWKNAQSDIDALRVFIQTIPTKRKEKLNPFAAARNRNRLANKKREKMQLRINGIVPKATRPTDPPPTKVYPAGTPLYLLSRDSGASKTAGCSTTYSPKNTCPPSCGLYRTQGCYAESGFVGMHWSRLDEASRLGHNGTRGRKSQGMPWAQHLIALARLKTPRLRLNVAGDLPGVGEKINGYKMGELAVASTTQGKKAWTYTHKPPTKENLDAMWFAHRRGLIINLSADSVFDADRLMKTGLPVCAIVPHDMPGPIKTPGGARVIICPAQHPKNLTTHLFSCGNCGGRNGVPLCARTTRDYVIGFVTHGISKKHADTVAWKGLRPLPLFKE